MLQNEDGHLHDSEFHMVRFGTATVHLPLKHSVEKVYSNEVSDLVMLGIVECNFIGVVPIQTNRGNDTNKEGPSFVIWHVNGVLEEVIKVL